jgi:hypothetical protein
MEILFFILMILLLCVFGYAQQEHGVFRTPGTITLPKQDDVVSNKF